MQSIRAVTQGVAFHVLVGFSPPLHGDAFHDTHLSQIDLQPLAVSSVPCNPGPSSAVGSMDVEARAFGSVIVIVGRRGPKLARQDSSILHTERHCATILEQRKSISEQQGII